MKRLDDIKSRAEAATQGPWESERVYEDLYFVALPDVPKQDDSHFSIAELDNRFLLHDADFIAHARTDVPALVAAVEAVLELHALGIGDLFTAEGIEARLAHCVECTQVEHKFVVRYPCPTVTAIRTALGEDE